MPATTGSRKGTTASKATATKGTFDGATATGTRRTTRAVTASTGYTMADVAKHDKVRRESKVHAQCIRGRGGAIRTLVA